jgi:nickel-dependent lactate racemase
MKAYDFKYGKSHFSLKLPEKNVIGVIEGKNVPGLTSIPEEVKKTLDAPVDSLPLHQVVKPGDTVALIVSDITRAWINYPMILPTLVEYLNSAGITDENITIVLAVGAHRGHSQEELESLVTKELFSRIRVVDHQSQNQERLKYMGVTSFGTKVYLNKTVAETDKVILTGGVVYHFMAGYGGGRKSVLPGIAGYATIQQNHLRLLYPEGSPVCLNLADCASGKTAGNPMHEDQMEIAAMLDPDFLVNVVLNPEGRHAGIFTGHYITAWEKACRMVDQIYGVAIEEQADLVIASAGGFPKDINLYQTSKTIDNASHAVKPGGVVVLLAECRDIKEPPDFAQWFDLGGPKGMEKELRRNFTVPGYAALFEVQKATEATYIMVTLAENAELIRRVGMIPVSSLDEAMKIAYARCGPNPKIIVMPHAANTLPHLKSEV